jgi:nucleotide-binding universal stress UspA family protein
MYLVGADRLMDETTKEYETRLKSLEEMARKQNLNISSEIVVGHPAEMIVHYAEKKDFPLIIVGHKGRSKLEGMLLGSVSRNVASLAHCTVIIVRQKGT